MSKVIWFERRARTSAIVCVCIMFKLNAGTIVPKLVCHRYLPCFALIFCECTFFCNLAIFLPLDSCLADSDFLFVYLWKPVLTFFLCVEQQKRCAFVLSETLLILILNLLVTNGSSNEQQWNKCHFGCAKSNWAKQVEFKSKCDRLKD